MAVNVLDYVGIGINPKTGRRHEIKYLPKDADWEDAVGNPMRGLRLRQFNILIGNRETLSESPKFFKEPRGS